MAQSKDGISFKIIKHIADLSEPTDKGWRMELNIVSWNGNSPKYDIRNWNEDHSRSSKISTFTEESLKHFISELSSLDLGSLQES